MMVTDPIKEKRIALLVRAYALILSWPDTGPDKDSFLTTLTAEEARGECSEEEKVYLERSERQGDE